MDAVSVSILNWIATRTNVMTAPNIYKWKYRGRETDRENERKNSDDQLDSNLASHWAEWPR